MENLTMEDLKVIYTALIKMPIESTLHTFNKVALEIQRREKEDGKPEDKK